jgi:hypothetical protein
MSFNSSEFRANLIGDGARPNLFQVTLAFPTLAGTGAAAGQQLQFLAKGAQLPGATIGTVPLYYFGREVKFAGNRTFADWTLNIIADESFTVRTAIEQWMNAINTHSTNLRTANAATPSSYAIDAKVDQFGKTGNIISTYNFVGLFPIDLAPIELDWGTNDQIAEYSVTFAYQYWTNAVSTT